MKQRACTTEDFTQSSEEHPDSTYGFHELNDASRSIIDDVYTLKCVDEPLLIYGDFNTESAQNFLVTFEKCDPLVRKCKSTEEINEYLKQSYMIIIENA